MYNHRGAPTGTNHTPTPQAEQFRRTLHPLQGATRIADTIGTYLGRVGSSHVFSAEATGGGSTDSLMVPHNQSANFMGQVGGRYVFGRSGTSADVRPYDPKSHYGIPGAPLSDTPEDMADHKFQKGK